MFSKELFALLTEVIQSWQVIAVTVALVAYTFLVNYVARSYHRPRSISKTKPQKLKAAAVTNAGPKVASDTEDTNQALGLEESK